MIIPRLWLADDTQGTGDRRRHVVTYFDIHSRGHNYTITQAALQARAAAASGWHNNKVRITSLTAHCPPVFLYSAPDNPMMFSNHGPSPALPPVTNSYRTIIMITLVKTRRMFCFTTLLYQGKFWRVIKREGLRLPRQDGCGRGQFPLQSGVWLWLVHWLSLQPGLVVLRWLGQLSWDLGSSCDHQQSAARAR